jgi:uncharacterized protein (TIGR02594 family)
MQGRWRLLSRKDFLLTLGTLPLAFYARAALADDLDPVVGRDVRFEQLAMPPIETLDDAELFGYKPPTAAQLQKAQQIIDSTPKGPTPFDIAKSFVDRFFESDPEAISQWPSPSSWNPLVKEFFSATSLRANNDMIDWCAAFVNWCIERNNKKGTNSAASQSFVNQGLYKKTDQPKRGDLVVFTCYDKQSGKNLGLGHVAFFQESLANNQIQVIGGNQSANGHSSIISPRKFLTTPFNVYRHVGGEYVPCVYRLNSFLVIA